MAQYSTDRYAGQAVSIPAPTPVAEVPAGLNSRLINVRSILADVEGMLNEVHLRLGIPAPPAGGNISKADKHESSASLTMDLLTGSNVVRDRVRALLDEIS